jgi:hypothetical protein
MPIHVHPVLRSLEEAEESANLIPTLNSQGVTVQIAAETVGSAKKVVPVAYTRVINGVAYTAH